MKRTISGQVEAVLIAPDKEAMLAVRQPQVQVSFEGFEGDRHAGLTMSSSSRTSYYPRGTKIRNSRQVSIVSAEELAEVAAAMGIPQLLPEWLGANLLLSGIPALSFLPPGSRLIFAGGVVLAVEGENRPCTIAGATIQAQFPDVPDLTTAFPKAGLNKRGLVGWVEHPGVIVAGEGVQAQLREQVMYSY